MKRRRNANVYGDPYAKEPLSDAVTMVIGIAIATAIISRVVNKAAPEPIAPLSPEQFMSETVKPLTIVPDRLVTSSADQTVAQAIQPSPAPTPAPTPAVMQTGQVCVQWDLTHASPTTGVIPCLKYQTVQEVAASNTPPPLPAIPVVAFVPEISKLEGIHMNGDFGRRL